MLPAALLPPGLYSWCGVNTTSLRDTKTASIRAHDGVFASLSLPFCGAAGEMVNRQYLAEMALLHDSFGFLCLLKLGYAASYSSERDNV